MGYRPSYQYQQTDPLFFLPTGYAINTDRPGRFEWHLE